MQLAWNRKQTGTVFSPTLDAIVVNRTGCKKSSRNPPRFYQSRNFGLTFVALTFQLDEIGKRDSEK